MRCWGTSRTTRKARPDQEWRARFWQYEFYAQDNWRVSPKLTLDLGVRYNIIAPLYSALNNFSTFDPARFDPSRAPTVLASDGSLVAGTGSPTNGIVIFGDGFPDAAHGLIPAADDPAAARRSSPACRAAACRPNTRTSVRAWASPTTCSAPAARRSAAASASSTIACAPTISAPRPPIRRSIASRRCSTATSTIRPARRSASFPPNIAGIRDRHADAADHVVQSRRAARAPVAAPSCTSNYVGTLGDNLTRNGEHQPAPGGHAPQPAREHDQRQRAAAVSRLRQHHRSPRTRTSRTITACRPR